MTSHVQFFTTLYTVAHQASLSLTKPPEVYPSSCTLHWWFSLFCIHTHTHTLILFHILFHYGLSQDIEYSFLCYTEEPYYLSILYMSLPLLIPNSYSIPPMALLPLGKHKSVSNLALNRPCENRGQVCDSSAQNTLGDPNFPQRKSQNSWSSLFASQTMSYPLLSS